MSAVIDETGKRYGQLTVIRRAKGSRSRHALWWCKCSCGNETVVRGDQLRSGITHNCGCRRRSWNALPEGKAAQNSVYSQYKRNAQNRDLAWDLPEKDFIELTQKPCHYCGCLPSNRSSRDYYNGDYIYNGLDRKDPSEGYMIENVVPCCAYCNYLKGSRPYQELLDHIKRIAQYQWCLHKD